MLSMSESTKGLEVKGVLANTALGDEMHTLLQMGAIRGLSIGYRTESADYNADGVGLPKEIELWEVSLVSLPMNPDAQVSSVKYNMGIEAESLADSLRGLNERLLREVLKR